MRRWLAIVVALCGCKKVEDAPHVEMPPAADLAPLATATNTLAFELWAKAGIPSGNFALSPASISAALAMTTLGATGATRTQMLGVLHLDDHAIERWGTLSLALQNPARGVTLRIANRLFGQASYPFEAAFLDHTKRLFAAPLEPLDFHASPDAARVQINDWVSDQTEHRIKDLLPSRSVNGETRLVLVNAIYFLGEWASEFKRAATADQPFTVSPTTTKQVPTMHAMDSYRLAKADGMAMLELPYKGGSTAMLVILPDQRDGLAALEHTIDATKLASWIAKLQPDEVAVSLPRFVVDPAEPLQLADALIALGMPLAFDPQTADFTPIATPPDPSKRLYIGAVVHKAFVKVDEHGTEAAAATAVAAPEGAGARMGTEFIADHPFLFAIVDRATGLVLFLGRVADPS